MSQSGITRKEIFGSDIDCETREVDAEEHAEQTTTIFLIPFKIGQKLHGDG
jgi:hypothetical protein